MANAFVNNSLSHANPTRDVREVTNLSLYHRNAYIHYCRFPSVGVRLSEGADGSAELPDRRLQQPGPGPGLSPSGDESYRKAQCNHQTFLPFAAKTTETEHRRANCKMLFSRVRGRQVACLGRCLGQPNISRSPTKSRQVLSFNVASRSSSMLPGPVILAHCQLSTLPPPLPKSSSLFLDPVVADVLHQAVFWMRTK